MARAAQHGNRPVNSSTASLGCNGVWRSLVARMLWEHDVAGSNPVTPTCVLSQDIGIARTCESWVQASAAWSMLNPGSMACSELGLGAFGIGVATGMGAGVGSISEGSST